MADSIAVGVEPPAGPGACAKVIAPAKHAAPRVLQDLDGFGGPGVATEVRLAAASAELPVLLIGKSWCPFCAEALELLQRHGASPAVLNVDTVPQGESAHPAPPHRNGALYAVAPNPNSHH